MQEVKLFDASFQCYTATHDLYRGLVAAEPEVVDYALGLSRTEARFAVWHLHQRTVESDQQASAWLEQAKARLIELRDSNRAHAREGDVALLLSEIRANERVASRRCEKRASDSRD